MINPDAEAAATAVLETAVSRFGADRMALAVSWQKESAVLLELVMRHAPQARVFTLDTGVLFPETYAAWRAAEKRYGITVEAWRGQWVERLWAVDPERCCGMRKVEPLKRALAGAACWITGLRRAQSPLRASTPELAFDRRHGLFKAVPLATWSEADVWRFIDAHDLPYNPLHDRGYASIGCTHCTVPGEGRAGRWANSSKSECGMHAG
jgi:phosphoadenosine phosphosulfate reductase